MIKKILGYALLLIPLLSNANGIDDKCPSLTYKLAPVVDADQYLCNQEYAVAIDWGAKNPIYSTEYLSKDHIGKLPRTNDFRPDTRIPDQFESKPQDYLKSFCNGGRCDRGHITPDQDFSSCEMCVHESFLMSNMIPQNFNNNEVIWKKMEMYLRIYVKTHDPIYIITGPIYNSDKPTATIGVDHVWVPDLIFKIAIDSKTGKSISFMMPNTKLNAEDLPKYITNILTIEGKTGIKFDSSLDKTSIANYKDW